MKWEKSNAHGEMLIELSDEFSCVLDKKVIDFVSKKSIFPCSR